MASHGLALLVLIMAAVLVRHWRGVAGKALVLGDPGAWQHPASVEVLQFLGSSARMAGIVWLHGSNEAGRKRYLMILPTMLSEEAYRCLCVWYEHSVAELNREVV